MAIKIFMTPRKNLHNIIKHNWKIINYDHTDVFINTKGKKIGKRTLQHIYTAECLKCNKNSLVRWSDISQNKSTQCVECHNKEYLINAQLGIQKIGNTNSNYRGTKNVPAKYFTAIRLGAKSRKIDLEIDIYDLQEQWDKQKGVCAYTGLKLTPNFIKDKRNQFSLQPSLDRIDSSVGYTKDNIQWVCRTVNWAKLSLTHEEFLKLCKLVYKHTLK